MAFHVIFDMDGVILDTEHMYLNAWRKVAKENGLGDLDALIYRCIGLNERRTKELVTSYLGPKRNYDTLRAQVKDAFNLQARETGIPVKKGVYEIFPYLSSRKITMGLASSTRGERVIPQLTDAKLLAYFSAVVTGDMVRYSKPEPEIFLLCAEQMGVSPADTYVIEDSFNGITAAHRAGMMPIMVPDLKQPDEAIRAMTVTVEKDLHDVVKFLSEK